MTKILFLCTGNSARSQMAEGFARARIAPGVAVASAGTAPKGLHAMAVRVMAECGVDIASQHSKALADLPEQDFDLIITLCDQAAEACPILPGNPEQVHWNLPDPARAEGGEAAVLAAFRESRDRIRGLVTDLFERGYLEAFTRAKRQADLLLDNVCEGILAHDMQRRIFHFNAAAERITGYSRQEVLNRLCPDAFPGGLCGGKCQLTDPRARVRDESEKELEIVTKSGERRKLVMTVKVMPDARGEPSAILCCFRDVTREHQLARRLGEIEHFAGITGRDSKMQAIFDLIPDLAEINVPVLIQGESGTGKELVAAAIHNEGPRAARLFVPVNCGALPEGLLESELFGHVRGAFTGAIRDKKGRFELADGGTIFLDEIGDISPTMQVKLLRVLQEGHFERVGSEKTLKVDARVISATNKNLAREIAAGRFREDLFYRLSVVPITIPPLRERRGDIPLLAQHVLKRFEAEVGREGVELAQETLDFMMSYDWPGNVREMQNWMQFALVKCKGSVIKVEHLPPIALHAVSPPATAVGAAAFAVKPRRYRLTREDVQAALDQTKGNRVEAAKVLNVSRATLYRFLDREARPQ